MSANRYAKGQIYTIRSHQTDDVYIGSTCTALHKRMSHHRDDFKQWKEGKRSYITSFEIVKYDDAYIELLEDFPCDAKKELDRREGQLIRQNACVNKCVPGRTHAEYREDNKERVYENQRLWVERNRERVAENQRSWREENQEKKKQYDREYQQVHKIVCNARSKAHWEANKESISQFRLEKVTCECGAVVCRSYISTHKKSERHALLLEEKSQAIL